MNKRKFSYIFIISVVLLSVFLFGCSGDKIQFNRESSAQNLINKMKKQNINTQNSSGVLILKDESNQNSNIHFGPGDLNFDLGVKF